VAQTNCAALPGVPARIEARVAVIWTAGAWIPLVHHRTVGLSEVNLRLNLCTCASATRAYGSCVLCSGHKAPAFIVRDPHR
jgi:hypothetical protein